MLSLFAIGLLVFGEDENVKSLRQRHNEYNNDDDGQRTNFDQKRSLELNMEVILRMCKQVRIPCLVKCCNTFYIFTNYNKTQVQIAKNYL